MITGNFNEFQQQINKVLNKTQITMVQAVQKYSFDVFKGIVDNSPVDIGNLKSNWKIALNNATNEVNILDKSVSSQQAGNIAFQSLPKARATLMPDRWVIFNNVDYAVYVNDGTARQRAQFMIETGIEEANIKLRRFTNVL